MTNDRLNELHLAMGEFLTECAHLENIILSLGMACQTHSRSFDDIHLQFLDLTFGQKISTLKKVCSEYCFLDDHKPHIKKGLSQLDRLLPKRNFIVHGTTFEIGKGEEPIVAYRIGAPKKNTGYMNEFISNPSAAHSFTAAQVRKATQECIDCRAELATVVVAIFTALARK
jgi:hypothetical protein